MYPRLLTARECGVLTALLTVDFDGTERLRAQQRRKSSADCERGRPSIDFFEGRNQGMDHIVKRGGQRLENR